MEDPKRKLIRRMQWVIYPLAALMILETFVFKSGGPGPSPYAVAGRAMLLAMLAMFSLILLAFFLHLLGSLRRPHASAGLGGAHIVLSIATAAAAEIGN